MLVWRDLHNLNEMLCYETEVAGLVGLHDTDSIENVCMKSTTHAWTRNENVVNHD